MVKDELTVPNDVIQRARSIIAAGEAGCILIKDGHITDIEKGRGLSPLMGLYRKKGNKLEGAFVVDKVVGKAAAMLCVCAGAKGVFAELISLPAAEYLKDRRIPRSWAELSVNIKNRQGDGICPMESSVLDEEDPQAGLKKICDTLEKIKKLETIKEL